MTGTNNFSSNSAGIIGGAICTFDNTSLILNGTSNLNNNSAAVGGAILVVNAILKLNGTVSFTNNEANFDYTYEGSGTGGGVYLYNSTISTLPNTTVYWVNNHAQSGGAIYVNDRSNPFIYYTEVEKCTSNECFFKLPGQNLSSGIDVQFVFKNNSADDAGSVLYGGAVDNCTLIGLDSYSSGEVFNKIAHIEDENTTSTISSYPFRICHCESDLPNCNKSHIYIKVYPGETLKVSVVAVGQRNGTVAAEIRSGFRSMKDRDATL